MNKVGEEVAETIVVLGTKHHQTSAPIVFNLHVQVAQHCKHPQQ